MASISASGIVFAGLIAALAVSSQAAPQAVEQRQRANHSVIVEIAGLRDSRGAVRLCMTSRADSFPVCAPGSKTASVPARKGTVRYEFPEVPDGDYALAAFHDANGNGKLDRSLGIPREGFAFSQNPPLRPRAPTFKETRFTVKGHADLQLKLRYIL